MSTAKRISGLDGVRAISIALVIVSHVVATKNLELHSEAFDVGNLGVRVFFVISGFLITTLLIREHDKTGTLSLAQFYLRRTFRIFPAFYAFVGLVAVAWAAEFVTLTTRDIVQAVTYTINYHPARHWELGHIWSLSVEEQFYLLWPPLLLVCGMKRGPWLAGGFVVFAPVMRVLWWKAGWPGAIDEMYQTVMDAIGVGCLLAFVRPRLNESALYLRLIRSPLMLLALAGALFINYHRDSISIFYPAGETALNVTLAVIVDWAMRQENNLWARCLAWPPMAFVGTLSYSLYLWQQPFLNARSSAWVCAFPQNLVLSVSAALASFYLVEQPFLRLRERLSGKG